MVTNIYSTCFSLGLMRLCLGCGLCPAVGCAVAVAGLCLLTLAGCGLYCLLTVTVSVRYIIILDELCASFILID